MPASVADERDAARAIEIADVMRRVPGRVGDVELAAAGVDASRRPSARAPGRAGTGRTSPQSRSMSAPYSRVALASSFDGIDQVRRAALVHEDLDRRVLP